MEELTDTPEVNVNHLYLGKKKSKKTFSGMRDKLEYLQELLVDEYIEGLESGKLSGKDFAPIVTLLSQNKIVVTQGGGETQHGKIKKIMKRGSNDKTK